MDYLIIDNCQEYYQFSIYSLTGIFVKTTHTKKTLQTTSVYY